MGRHPITIAQLHGPNFVGATPPDMAAQESRIRLALDDAEARTRAVAAQVGYQLPADCTDPDLIQRDISANMRRSVEACLEVGRGLMVLKAACGHGAFIARLDVLGLEPRVAQRFMQAAHKLSNTTTSSYLLQAAGNPSKLFEMLILDDEQLDELALTGQTGELRLDDIATMSVKELRKKLRETTANYDAQGKLLAGKDQKINDLEMKLHPQRVVLTDWPEQFVGLINQAQHARRTIEHHLGVLDIVRTSAMDVIALPGEEASLEKARQALGAELLASIDRAEECIAAVRHKFNITLGDLLGL